MVREARAGHPEGLAGAGGVGKVGGEASGERASGFAFSGVPAVSSSSSGGSGEERGMKFTVKYEPQGFENSVSVPQVVNTWGHFKAVGCSITSRVI